MANTNQSVRTCVLKVDIKCCTGCQKKASTKLQKKFPGITAAEYNAEKGLMTVTGDVDPMALIKKLDGYGKKTELVSVNYQIDDLTSDEEDDTSSSDTSSNPDSKPMKRETQVEKMTTATTNKKKGLLRKSLLLGCFSSKSKVLQPLPMPNRNWRVPSKFENPNGPHGYHPFANATTSSSWGPPRPMMSYPHPMMQQQPQPMMQQQPHPMMQHQSQAPMPHNATMFPQAQPPSSQPYFMKVNPKLHYSS